MRYSDHKELLFGVLAMAQGTCAWCSNHGTRNLCAIMWPWCKELVCGVMTMEQGAFAQCTGHGGINRRAGCWRWALARNGLVEVTGMQV